jgi:NAD(P)-dependent dehydrogenase (short-subunit alcohol dehydrogenase family)
MTRIALVTGAGRPTGIGAEVAKQLAAREFEVITTARKASQADLELDITSPESVAFAVEHVRARYGKLDVLVNNAAATSVYGEQPAVADLSRSRDVVDTTLFGTWRLTQAMLPLLRAGDHPRIVNVSSGAGSHGDEAFGLTTPNAMGPSYAIAKCALNALTVLFATELQVDGILVNAVCPGFTATFEGAEQMGARPVAEGAASVVWAAVLPDDGPSGGFFRDGKRLPW